MDSTSSDASAVTSKMVPSGVSGSGALQYLNPDYMPPSLDSKNSPLAMLARTCNSIGKDSLPSKAVQQPQQQQQPATKQDMTTRHNKSTSPGKKSSVAVDGVTSRKEQSSTSSTQSRQSTTNAGRRRSSLYPTCCDGDTSTRRGDVSRWDGTERALSSGGSPASTSRTADSDRDSVEDLRCSVSTGRHHDRQQRRQTLSPPFHHSSDAPPSLGLYESLRLQQEAAALQAAAVYSPLHQLLQAQRQFTDPLAMYSASLQAAAVVAAATQASLRHAAAGRLPGKDYRLGDVLRPCGVDSADLISNGDVDAAMFGGMLPLRPPVPSSSVTHSQQPHTCSWLISGGEFCAQRFSTSEELFSHLRTHVDSATAASEDPLRCALPPVASCSAFAPSVGGFLSGQSGSLPGTFGIGSSTPSLAAAHAAASFYRSKVRRSGRSSLRDAATASPTSTAAGGAASLLFPAAAAAAASSRYHPYKWTPSPFVASQLASALGTAAGLPNSDLTPPVPPALSAFLQQPPYAALFSAPTLGTAVP